MPIAADSRGTATTAYVQGNETLAHTVSGSDRFLAVQSVLISTASERITGMTYNGVSMTKLFFQVMANTRAQSFAVYTLPATGNSTQPSTGTNNIVISKTGTTLSDRTGSQAGSYTGVDANDPIGDFTSTATFGTGSPADITTAVNPDLSNSWIIGAGSSAGGALSATTVTTTQYQVTMTGNSGAMSDSGGTVTTGSKTVTYNINDSWKMLGALVIQPSASATVNSNFFALM
jgi:hypothetical protein